VNDDPVYQSDPLAAPDHEFEPGELAHLAPGNRGRMLDPRRTPIVVTRLLPRIGMFELEVAAFEDAGACWEIEVERVGSFQFEPDQAKADDASVAEMEEAISRLDHVTHIPCRDDDRRTTLDRVAVERERANALLEDNAEPVGALERFMAERNLAELEEAFADRFVSNASSGELVKGHAIVLARLGLCPYAGKIQRDPALFAGDWSEGRRSEHIVSRLAFVRELFASEGVEKVTLYRGLASDQLLRWPEPRSFVSATFDPRVAEAHFAGGSTTVAAALYRQAVPVERLFMTYRETCAMNRRFQESEAVLIGDPSSPLF
jgi:hypothetical protein